MTESFDHEKLRVYQAAIRFVTWTYDLSSGRELPTVVKNQLERSAVSIPLNIAEGNGKSSPRDRCRYFEIARGSALESAAAIDILLATAQVTADEGAAGKVQLHGIFSMLVGLIKSSSDTRLAETSDDPYLPS